MKAKFIHKGAGMAQGLRGLMAALIWGIMGLTLSLPAAATIVTATPNNDFTGTIGTTGFPTITFDDKGSAGSVEITIDLTNLLPTTAFTSDWWFNFSGDATQLTFANFIKDPANSFADPTIETCNNCTSPSSFRPGGGGFFDVHLAFETSANERFNSGEVFIFDALLAGITADNFNLQSIAGPGDTSNDFHCVATHVQGLTSGGGSDHLGAGDCTTGRPPQGIPEPGILLLVGSGLLGLALLRRRLKS